MNKNDQFMWMASIVKEKVDKGFYGSVTLTMQNGAIGLVKVEEVHKAPVDEPR